MLKTPSVFFVTAAIAAAVCVSFAQKASDIDSVTLDKDRVFEVCHTGRRSQSGECTQTQATVNVITKTRGTKMDGRSIYYIPSGGKIVGSGAEVIWDLTDARPGNHWISVGIGTQDVIEGNVITKALTVKECPVCDPPCSCPTLGVEGPTGLVRAGNAFIVRARVAGGDNLTYKWTISTGAVVDSAYSQSILVKTTKQDAGKELTVTLEIGGADPVCNCPTSDSITVPIQKR